MEIWTICHYSFQGERSKRGRIPIFKKDFSVSRRTFEKMVKEAIETIPPEMKERLENVAFLVQKKPSDLPQDWEEDQGLLGLYHGVSRKDRGISYGNVLPDRIVIYQWPLEKISSNLEELKENVRQTVIHEVGHYFGFDEDELRQLEEEGFQIQQENER
jgi:predicted Zn-dependent protease with MMP-like domain